MSSLRGPDGSPSDPDELGSSGSAPAAADAPTKKPIPWPAEGAARGPLAMSADDLAAFMTPEDKAEVGAKDEAAGADEILAPLPRGGRMHPAAAGAPPQHGPAGDVRG
jgi:hypothetical protein